MKQTIRSLSQKVNGQNRPSSAVINKPQLMVFDDNASDTSRQGTPVVPTLRIPGARPTTASAFRTPRSARKTPVSARTYGGDDSAQGEEPGLITIEKVPIVRSKSSLATRRNYKFRTPSPATTDTRHMSGSMTHRIAATSQSMKLDSTSYILATTNMPLSSRTRK
jgi:hypothetical protein